MGGFKHAARAFGGMVMEVGEYAECDGMRDDCTIMDMKIDACWSRCVVCFI